MRTYVIEPQLVFVPFLERLLGEAGLEVVATASDVDSKDLAALAPAAIFVDVDFFERGGPNALCRIRQAAKTAALIAYSDVDDPTFEAACHISGASAVCSKRDSIDKIVAVVRRAVNGPGSHPARTLAASA